MPLWFGINKNAKLNLSIFSDKMGDHIMLDLEEWALVLNKMLR